uniref:Uncharacterized protein n=1 Tax=Caenorhabditis japonica TaxID=281687 RepID=A0A8R1EM59_CAEJA
MRKPAPKAKDVLDEDLLKAIDGVAENIHPESTTGKKSLKNTLINRLVANEKASFDTAAASASSEMLDDQALIGLLADVAGDAKIEKKLPPKSAQLRQEKRGLVLLRKEIFYQAIQSAEAPSARKALLGDVQDKSEREEAEQAERSEREQKLFTMALEFLEKIYKDDLMDSDTRKPVNVDPNAVKLFDQRPLGIWKKAEKYEELSLGFWNQWDQRAAA